MICAVCIVFEYIPVDNRFIHAPVLHIKILHKQAQWNSSGCESCKQIQRDIEEDRQVFGSITQETCSRSGLIRSIHQTISRL